MAGTFGWTRRAALAAGAGLLAAPAIAQGIWPNGPIRFIGIFPPGGGTDILSRLVATKLTESAKWTVVADNKAGAGGTIGIGEAVKAAPTGYDLVMGQKDNMVVAPWLYKNLSYSPFKDFAPISIAAVMTHALSVGDRFTVLIQGRVASQFKRGEKTREEVLNLLRDSGKLVQSAFLEIDVDIAGRGERAGRTWALALSAASGASGESAEAAELKAKGVEFDAPTWRSRSRHFASPQRSTPQIHAAARA